MHQLIVLSRATPPPTAEQLEAIRAAALPVLRTAQVSSLLISWNRYYLQLLEGLEVDVRRIFDGLAAAPHQQLVGIRHDGEVPSRRFAAWKMGVFDLDRPDGVGRQLSSRHPALGEGEHYQDPMLAFDLFWDAQHFGRPTD